MGPLAVIGPSIKLNRSVASWFIVRYFRRMSFRSQNSRTARSSAGTSKLFSTGSNIRPAPAEHLDRHELDFEPSVLSSLVLGPHDRDRSDFQRVCHVRASVRLEV